MDSQGRVVLDLHGARAKQGIDIDALEVFLRHFRTALRELDREMRQELAKRGGRPDARDAAATAFRLVKFKTGSGIATLEPARVSDDEELVLDDSDKDLSLLTLQRMVEAIEEDKRLPEPVVEALSSARRAIGEDGSFGVKLGEKARKGRRVVVDEALLKKLQAPATQDDGPATAITGRLHMIEVDQPRRRVGIRAPDGIDWTCSYPDAMHDQITSLIERLVRAEGEGRRLTATTGLLRIAKLSVIPEHTQDALFTVETIPLGQLSAEQGIDQPQGLEALVDPDWEDDEEGLRFLEATLGSSRS